MKWARELFPQARSYLDVYAGFGLMRERAVYAHCIHFDDDDRRLMRETGAATAVSPTSNLFLGSGFFDFEGADRIGYRYGLASDVGGGTSFSPFHTMLAAYYVGREGQTKPGVSIAAVAAVVAPHRRRGARARAGRRDRQPAAGLRGRLRGARTRRPRRCWRARPRWRTTWRNCCSR